MACGRNFTFILPMSQTSLALLLPPLEPPGHCAGSKRFVFNDFRLVIREFALFSYASRSAVVFIMRLRPQQFEQSKLRDVL